MHGRSLARFPFDLVLLPDNFRQMEEESYAARVRGPGDRREAKAYLVRDGTSARSPQRFGEVVHQVVDERDNQSRLRTALQEHLERVRLARAGTCDDKLLGGR